VASIAKNGDLNKDQGTQVMTDWAKKKNFRFAVSTKTTQKIPGFA